MVLQFQAPLYHLDSKPGQNRAKSSLLDSLLSQRFNQPNLLCLVQ
jgi:hypothetical protein